MNHSSPHLRASLSVQLPPDAKGLPTGFNIQLFPEGQFTASDGRPGSIQGCEAKAWTMNATIAPDIITDVDARGTRPMVDYEHQSIRTRENGQPAPAAGWIQSLAYFPGRGLFAKVEWTERARQLIKAGEYRYISPLFEFDKTSGAVLKFINAALTNTPALDGLVAVAASLNFDGNTTVADLVKKSVMEGVLPKALEGWAVALGNQHPQKLRDFLGKLRPHASYRTESSQAALTVEECEVARLLGKTGAEFLEDKSRVAFMDNPPMAALTSSEREAARRLGMTEVEFLAGKEAF